MNKYRKMLFDIYFFLFFFVMINRECTPFKLDLRIPIGILGIILFLWGGIEVCRKKQKIIIQPIDWYIIAFFMLSFFSNLIWVYNGLSINKENFVVIFISYAFNFLAYLIFRFHQQLITIKKFNQAMLISTLVLIFSILMAFIGVDITKYLMSGCRGYVEDLARNFMGGIYRYGGYAEDPNYASLFFIFAFATYLYCQRKLNKKDNIVYLSLFLFGFMLSASKTTLIALFPAIVFLILKEFKPIKIIKYIWMSLIILIPIILIFIQFDWFDSMVTMTQRFKMWQIALDLSKQSPIIGNGLTAFRSYAETVGLWYVQCHSTIFQMLSETGIVSLMLLGVIMTLSLLKNNKYLTFMITLFSIYMITTETAYHIYFVFILAILPIIVEECELCKKPPSLL